MLVRGLGWPVRLPGLLLPQPALSPRRLLPSASSPAFSRRFSLHTAQRPGRSIETRYKRPIIPSRHLATAAAASRPPSSSPPHTPRSSGDSKPQRNLFNLRPYQQECVNSVLDELKKGEYSRLGVSSPTGSGKTAMFTNLISLIPPRIHPVTGERADQVLVIVNSIQLATQTGEAIRRAYPDLVVDVEQGDSRGSGLGHVTVATFQTLARDDCARLEKFIPERHKAVIIDEAHHAASPSYIEILSRFDSEIEKRFEGEVSGTDPDPLPLKLDSLGRARVPLIAFTATWGRSDGIALGKVFEKIVWHGEWLDMIRGKWLSQLQFTTIRLGDRLNLDEVDVSRQTGDFVPSSLANAMDKSEFNNFAIDAWFEKAQDRRSTLIFAASVPHSVNLANAFRERGIDARFVSMATKQADRAELYRAFRAGEYPVLINYGILTEGADFPEIDCVLLARPTKSQNLFLQMIGRGLRLSPHTDKKDCLIIDLLGSAERSGGMMCTPTLFGLDPDTEIIGKSTEELEEMDKEEEEGEEKEEEEKSPVRRLHSIQYQHFTTAFDLVEHLANPRDPKTGENVTPEMRRWTGEGGNSVARLSRNAWVGCGNNVFILQLMNSGWVKMSPHPEHGFMAQIFRSFPNVGERKSQAVFSQTIATGYSPRECLLKADTYLKNHRTFKTYGLGRYAKWRSGEATDRQKEMIINRLIPKKDRENGKTTISGVWVGKPMDVEVDIMRPGGLTKGQASDIISRCRHGAIAHWKRTQSTIKKEERQVTSERKKAEQERIKVENKAERERAAAQKKADQLIATVRARRTRKEEAAAAAGEAVDGEDVEGKPKRRKSRKKAGEDASGQEGVEAGEEKPKRRRTRKKVNEDDAEGEVDGEASEEKPKKRRTRKEADEEFVESP
ncbi:UvrABC complex, subunit B [Rhodotorula toruloides NP11]|uniref:UvrABC complex, subunit B n=1 Tax=Rhodotorula toruloides (strain NP11) TaxID=1130832 RepID=M7XLY8_RHOT1|nr:UvrABC complex, subunit B [Rhodotorula toruloides NP11]EMS24929.1 UvrABC complex, subunit B [Rhodotorula toruloides NP11]